MRFTREEINEMQRLASLDFLAAEGVDTVAEGLTDTPFGHTLYSTSTVPSADGTEKNYLTVHLSGGFPVVEEPTPNESG